MKCIFHMPLPLDKKSKSASGIRPCKMLQAFKDIGYDVYAITGYAKERKAAIKTLKKKIQEGEKFDFLYSESSTMPTALTEKKHIPPHYLLDFSFFKFCAKQSIKIGLFYRDIYWKFDDIYKCLLPKWKYICAIKSYQYDLWQYKRLLTKFYVPSEKIYPYIEIPELKNKLDTLPPGCEERIVKNKKILQRDFNKEPLKIFYVGGLGSEYKILELFKAVSMISCCDLTICCREKEWNDNIEEYKKYINFPNIHIVHVSGDSLNPYYESTDICSLIFKPNEYRNLAVPFKAFEYLSWEKPTLVSKNTLIGDWTERNGTGWLVKYQSDDIYNTVMEIINHPQDLYDKVCKCKIAKQRNLWTIRAQKVALDLRGDM